MKKAAKIFSIGLAAIMAASTFMFSTPGTVRAEENSTDISNVSNADWMGALDDDIPITDLSIPGTHDSATAHTKFEDAISTAQFMPIGPLTDGDTYDQLDLGVRYFDLRLYFEKDRKGYDTWALCHGSGSFAPCFYTSSTIAGSRITMEPRNGYPGIWGWMEQFLKKHSSETVILEIALEDSDGDSDEAKQKLYDYLEDYALRDGSIVWKGNSIPTLKEARGKLIF